MKPMRPILSVLAILALHVSAAFVTAQPADGTKPAAIAELFEDEAEAMLKLLTNPGDAGGQGMAEGNVVFSGTKSLKITEYQRFHRQVPGWNFAIREKPKPGEYRYLRFAWRAGGANCLMLQLHDALDWNLRYTAGPNPYGWATKFVADKAPGSWSLVTIDLFKDFGERTLTGIAFTIHGGAGYFDHVYLGRSVDDLDRIDATGLAKKELKLTPEDLERLWRDLVSPDAAKQYRALWTLSAGGEKSAAFIKGKLAVPKGAQDETKQLQAWIRALGSESFQEREKASSELKKRLAAAVPLLEAELAGSPSLEVRRRIDTLLAGRPLPEPERLQRQAGQRILQNIAARAGRQSE